MLHLSALLRSVLVLAGLKFNLLIILCGELLILAAWFWGGFEVAGVVINWLNEPVDVDGVEGGGIAEAKRQFVWRKNKNAFIWKCFWKKVKAT